MANLANVILKKTAPVSGSSRRRRSLRRAARGDEQGELRPPGEVTDIRPRDRVRVSGKQKKRNVAAQQKFLVEKLKKDYRLCTAATTTPEVAKKKLAPPCARQAMSVRAGR